MKTARLSVWRLRAGFVAAASYLTSALDALVEGSRNFLLLGAVRLEGELAPAAMRNWKGLQSKGAGTGARKAVVVGKRWGGIKDIGGTQGSGSLFEDFGRSLWMIGAGQPSIEGADLTGITLSTSLKVAIAVAGVYSAANTYTAGLGQPSAPDVEICATPGAGFTGVNKGAISIKIARVRSSTGGRSRASTTSVVVEPNNQSFKITFPAAASGQDVWRVFGTQAGFGGVGLHYGVPRTGSSGVSSLDILESDVAASSLDGAGSRKLEFEYRDGDLVPVTAWTDDFAPPAGTHAARVGQCMVVLGAYADSSSAVSSTSPGTAGAVSVPNFYESYRPADLVFFPEQVADVKGREWDDFAYVAHANSLTTLQFMGAMDEGPAVAVGVAWPDVGFQYAHNWTTFYGRVAGMVARGSLVMMTGEGKADYTWGDKVADFIKSWEPSATVVGFDPRTRSLVVMNGGTALSYSLENGAWSPPCYFADAGVSGSALSAVTSQGELVVSADDAGAHTAYSWDSGASAPPYASAVTNWREADSPATLHGLACAFDCDSAAGPLILAAHANLRKTFARDGAVTSGSPLVTSAGFRFDSEHAGDVVVVFGANVGGAGVHYLTGRATYVSATQVSLADLSTGAALNAQATLSGCHFVVAHDALAFALSRTGPQQTGPLDDILARDANSFSVGVHLFPAASGAGARVSQIEAHGTLQGEREARTA